MKNISNPHSKTEVELNIARVATVPEAFVHIKFFLKFLKDRTQRVVLISSIGPYEEVLKHETGHRILPIDIKRKISLWHDLKTFFQLILIFRRERFNIVHSSTPKAGIAVALAGALFPKTIRIHTFTGQRWATLKGPLRSLLKFLDKVVIFLNHQCYADSESQIEFLIREGVTKPGEIICLNKGSYGGIDCNRFDRSKYPNAKADLLKELGIAGDPLVLIFAGRIGKEKGINELIAAFQKVKNQIQNVVLILMGPIEDENNLMQATSELIRSDKSIFHIGFKADPEKYFCGSDILCLPSYREGFGTVVIEAASCGLPTIGTEIPGLKDAIINGITGLLVPVKDKDALAEAIINLYFEPERRFRLGQQALERARRDFSSEILAESQWREYLRLTKKIS